MALLKLSGLVTRLSGKLGGSVLSYGQSGQVLKQNAFSINGQTIQQSISRSNIQQITARWHSLTPTQKATYQSEVGNYTYVNKVGDTVNYNAYQIFLLVNYNLFQVGLPLLTTCPSYASSVYSTWSASLILPTGFTVEKSDANNGNILQVFCAVSKQLVTNTSSLNFVKISQNTVTAGNQVILLTPALIDVFPFCDLEYYIYTKIKEIDTTTGIPTGFLTLETVFFP